ncbi:MAG TPA: LysR family transcriptional regulator [Candidatus Didemnitutus sp.]|nr:LysR family transcriptional regulator [Candidatus Didemnitutus sp.]
MFEKLFSERGLSLDRLRVMVEVHDAGGIAKAAPGDPIRQSQYSRQLRELSEFFGTEVARRHGRQLRLTPQGIVLAELVRSQMQSLQDFRAECRAETVDFTIAAGDSLIQWLVIPRLAAVTQRQTTVRFATTNLRTNEIVQQMKDGRVDFGILRKDAASAPLKTALLGTLSFVAVVPKRLVPTKAGLAMRDLLHRFPFATHTSDGQFTQKLREIAVELKSELRPSLICQSFPQAAAAVRSGGFWSVLPALALNDLEADSYWETPADPLKKLDRPIVLAWNPRLLRVRPSAKGPLEALQAGLRF